MKNLLIVGTGGWARSVYDYALDSRGYGKEFIVKGFLEGNIPCDYSKYKNLPAKVFGNCLDYEIQENDIFAVAIADPIVKETVVNVILNKQGKFINLIHNTAIVSTHSKIGNGVIMAPFSIVANNAVVDDFVMINTYSAVTHDCIIGKFTSIMGHVSINGNTIVGHHTYWGCGSKTVPGSKIGDYAKIGAMSLVLKKVKTGSTVFGVPAVYI